MYANSHETHSTAHVSLFVLENLESMHDENSFAILIYLHSPAARSEPRVFSRLWRADSNAAFPSPATKLHETVY